MSAFTHSARSSLIFDALRARATRKVLSMLIEHAMTPSFKTFFCSMDFNPNFFKKKVPNHKCDKSTLFPTIFMPILLDFILLFSTPFFLVISGNVSFFPPSKVCPPPFSAAHCSARSASSLDQRGLL